VLPAEFIVAVAPDSFDFADGLRRARTIGEQRLTKFDGNRILAAVWQRSAVRSGEAFLTAQQGDDRRDGNRLSSIQPEI